MHLEAFCRVQAEMTWATGTLKNIDPQLQALLNDFVLKDGKVSMPDAKLEQWRRTHGVLPVEQRMPRGKSMVALAARLARKGPPTVSAVAQLCVLAADLLSSTKPATTAARTKR